MDLPDELNQVRQILERNENGSRDFAHILSYIPLESAQSVISACSYALEIKAVSKDIILNDKPDIQDIIEEKDPEYLELKDTPAENCRSYDQLLSAVSIQATSIRGLHYE